MILSADNVPVDLVMEDFNVIVMNMDTGIPEQINENSDGSYTVFLNARHTRETNTHSMDHSFNHVREGDWERDDVQEIETTTHKYDKQQVIL